MILGVFISQLLPPSPVNPIANAVAIVAVVVVFTVQVGGETRVEPPARFVVECAVAGR